MKPTRIDQWALLADRPGSAVDLGWGWARVNADDTVTRTCKGCGSSVTSPIVRQGNTIHVEPQPFEHKDNCPVWADIQRYLGRN
jgi:hypothetical protein